MLKKRILIAPIVVAVALAAASCGGGSGSSGSGAAGAGSNSSTANGQRPGRPQLTDSQTACLEQQGVTAPGGGNGGQGGRPPGGGNGTPYGDQLTDEQRQQMQERRQKMIAAFEKCGIPAPQFGGGNGQGAGQPPSGGGSQ